MSLGKFILAEFIMNGFGNVFKQLHGKYVVYLGLFK